MHLLNVTTHKLEHFSGSSIPPYAILSHTWAEDEVTFQDLKDDPNFEMKAGWKKIDYTCKQAARDQLSFAWVDTCCIDKSSSAELSEAINAMFRWYERATRCYAFLADVLMPDVGDPGQTAENGISGTEPILAAETSEAIARSRWFTRGWTLQELIAPRDVVFFDQHWTMIGYRTGHLIRLLSWITGIQERVLRDARRLRSFSIAQRMSWAAKRNTTRTEDEAYCLLGIFGVNMPMLYGEEENAFVRLQEEIIRSSTDQSVFAWKYWASRDFDWHDRLLATSPRGFADCSGITHTFRAEALLEESYETTNAGLRITLPLIKYGQNKVLGLLNCREDGRLLTLSLRNSVMYISEVEDRAGQVHIGNIYHVTRDPRYGKRTLPVSLEAAASGKRESTIIMKKVAPRNELRYEREANSHYQLWLRVAEPTFAKGSLRYLGSWPETCWVFSGAASLRELASNARATAQTAQFRPIEQLPCGGIAVRDIASGKRIVICFFYSARDPLIEPLVQVLETSMDVEECCFTLHMIPNGAYWQDLAIRDYNRMRSVKSSLSLDSTRQLKAEISYKTIARDIDVLLQVTLQLRLLGEIKLERLFGGRKKFTLADHLFRDASDDDSLH